MYRKAKRDTAHAQTQSREDDQPERASVRQLVLQWLVANANTFALFCVKGRFAPLRF